MQPDYTHITVVFDRSKSMKEIADEALGGFNRFVSAQRSVQGHATLRLFWFNEHVTDGLNWVPVDEHAVVKREDYQPAGFTALYDAIAVGILKTGRHLLWMPENERPSKVIFVIITDGLENASREYTAPHIKTMIETQREKHGWSFVFLGANQDAIEEGGNLGIAPDAALTFTAAGPQTADTFAALTDATTSLRTGDTEAFTFTAEHRARAVGWSDGAKVV